MNLYKNEHSDAKSDAQKNLMGRTHYCDPDTLRWHKSRILVSRVHSDGLLFSIIESVALDVQNSQRGFRYVIFDVFGTVLHRPNLDESFKKRAAAEKALFTAVGGIDAIQVTKKALENKRKNDMAEFVFSMRQLKKMTEKATG